jgi:hypothetical protein
MSNGDVVDVNVDDDVDAVSDAVVDAVFVAVVDVKDEVVPDGESDNDTGLVELVLVEIQVFEAVSICEF